MALQCKTTTGENFVIGAIILLTSVLVVCVTYSLYLFIDLTKVTNVANVHITKNLLLAVQGAQGKLYSNSEAGITDWIIYKDEKNGFEIKYPNDFVSQKQDANNKHLFSLKKYNSTSKNGSDSLNMAIFVDSVDVSDSVSLKEILKQKDVEWNDSWKQETIGNKAGIRTGEIQIGNGAVKDYVFWKLNGKLYSLEGDYMNSNNTEEEAIFEKIISEFSFI